MSSMFLYLEDQSHVLSVESIDINHDLTYNEEPILIQARELKHIRNTRIPLVMVLWINHSAKQATWERVEKMMTQYPNLL